MKRLVLLALPMFFVCTYIKVSGQNGYWGVSAAELQTDRYDDIFFLSEDTGFAINPVQFNTYSSIYKTTNMGGNWQQMPSSNHVFFRDISFLSSQHGFIGTLQSNGTDTAVMYTTNNGGNTWQPVSNLPGPRPMGICGQFAVNDSVLYAVGRFNGPAVFISTHNGGASWTYKDLSAFAGGLVDVHFFNADTGFAVGTNGTYDTDNGVILYTTDGGQNWQVQKTSSRMKELCWKISFPNRDTGYVSLESTRAIAADTQYILKTVDGGLTWQEQQVCICGNEFQGIGFRNSNEGWLAGRSGYNLNTYYSYHTIDGGANWTPINNLRNVNRFRFLTPDHGYAAGDRIYEFRSPSCIIKDTASETACGGYGLVWHGSLFFMTGFYNVWSTSHTGCDTLYTLKLTTHPCTDVPVTSDDIRLSIFPNPTTGTIHIETDYPYACTLALIDLAGRQISMKHMNAGEATMLDVSDFESGMYFIRLYNETGLEVQRKVILE